MPQMQGFISYPSKSEHNADVILCSWR